MVASLSSWILFMSWMVLFRSLMSFSSCVIRLSCVVSLSLWSSVSCLLVYFSVFISSCVFFCCVFSAAACFSSSLVFALSLLFSSMAFFFSLLRSFICSFWLLFSIFSWLVSCCCLLFCWSLLFFFLLFFSVGFAHWVLHNLFFPISGSPVGSCCSSSGGRCCCSDLGWIVLGLDPWGLLLSPFVLPRRLSYLRWSRTALGPCLLVLMSLCWHHLAHWRGPLSVFCRAPCQALISWIPLMSPGTHVHPAHPCHFLHLRLLLLWPPVGFPGCQTSFFCCCGWLVVSNG